MLRELAHLQEQLGNERFQALISSDNTGKVKEFCDGIIKDTRLTEMTVGGRTYEILGFLEGDETSVVGHTMVKRAKKMNANLGKDDGKHILKHQDEIPASLRGKVVFVFPDWRRLGDSENAYCVCWYGGRWLRPWFWLGGESWIGSDRVLRRK